MAPAEGLPEAAGASVAKAVGKRGRMGRGAGIAVRSTWAQMGDRDWAQAGQNPWP